MRVVPREYGENQMGNNAAVRRLNVPVDEATMNRKLGERSAVGNRLDRRPRGDVVRGKEIDYLVSEAREMGMDSFRT